MQRLLGLSIAIFSTICAMNVLAYGPWQPGMMPPATVSRSQPALVAFQVNSYWDRAGDFRVHIAHQGLNPDNFRLRLLPGHLVIEVRRVVSRQAPFGRSQQSGNMRQSVALPRGVNPRRLTVVETNSGIEVRIPAWRYRY